MLRVNDNRSNKDIPDDITVINVCDREGDIYELFEKAIATEQLFLIRIVQNRTTATNEKLIDAIKQETPKGTVKVEVPRDSRRNIKKREATLEISFRQFEVKKPMRFNAHKTLKDTVTMNVIYVKEIQADKNINPIEWILATNESVNNFDEAYEKIGYYDHSHVASNVNRTLENRTIPLCVKKRM
jgi:hypothetical protein